MPTYTALTTLADGVAARALGDAMERMTPAPTGLGVFEMEDGSGLWEVGGYFVEPPDTAALALLSVAFDAREFTVSELPEIDWVAKVKRELRPVEAGRFVVHGSHDSDNIAHDKIGLLIEAAMAFGTGHHGTTLGCLRALDRLESAGLRFENALDLGCGTAVLAMAAVHLWGRDVVATDIDPVAIEVAEANIAVNGLSNRVHCAVADGMDHPILRDNAPFDLVVANILKAPLISLAPDIAALSADGAYAVLSGILLPQADDVIEVYISNGYSLDRRDEIGDWATLTLRKHS